MRSPLAHQCDDFELGLFCRDGEQHRVVQEIDSHGVSARGFKNTDKMLTTVKKSSEKDLGFVGEIVGFDKTVLDECLKTSIPVICPMGLSKSGEPFDINADEVAFFLASQL